MEKKKVMKIIGWCIFTLFVAGTVVAFVFGSKIDGPERVFVEHKGWGQFANYMFAHFLPNLIRSVQIITITAVVFIVLSLLAKITFESKKTITVTLLILNFAKWAAAIVALFLVLAQWGASATMTLAAAGLLTLVIGLGSQSLVADILAGIFMVFEGEFQVGDIVIVDGWRGEVKSISIRTTKLVDAGGNIKIINNSDIRSVINQTQELSVAKCYVGISYGDRIENVEKVIADNLPAIKERIPAIVEGPFYKGVTELADSSVNLLFVAKCKESDIYQVQRDLNREIKILFDDNNINIPFPQITVSYDHGSDNATVSKKVKHDAEEFVEEQKVLSKNIDDRK